jgi:hypothetical protein
MEMTHYMQLLAENQPWNLILFMAIPVILAETIAIAELYILFTRDLAGKARTVSRVAGIIAGPYMLGVFVYLFWTAVIPLTTSGGWRGIGDVLAVGGYLLSALPLIGIGALEFGLIGKQRTEEGRLKIHATLVAIFLVLAHVAMIFGMLEPSVLGWVASESAMHMPGMMM